MIEQWLRTYVNDPHFAADLQALIESADPKDRLKIKLSLLDYFAPKVKGVDAVVETQDKEITIQYGVADASRSKPAPVPDGSPDE